MENELAFTEAEFAGALAEVLETTEELEVVTCSSFEDEGLMTSNSGVVVRLANGQQFQLTVVRSR